MIATLRKTKTKPVAGDRVPLTARDCWLTIAVYGSLVLFVVALLFGMDNRDKFFRAFQMLVLAWPAYYALYLLSQMRRGKRFETVYSTPSPKLQRSRVMRYKTLAIAMNVLMLGLSAFMISLMRGAHPDAAIVLIVGDAIFLVWGIVLFLRAEKMSHALESQIVPVTSETSVTAVVSTLETQTAQTNTSVAGTSRAEHWWTDTQAREEAKVTVKR